jgi:hypothetical protein
MKVIRPRGPRSRAQGPTPGPVQQVRRPVMAIGAIRRTVVVVRVMIRLPANRPVGEFTNQICVPVVAGVFLDHVDVDPPEGARFIPPGQPGVAETPGGGRVPARRALGLPRCQVGVPVSVIERDHLAVLYGRVVPDAGRTGLPLEDPPEPGARSTSAMSARRPANHRREGCMRVSACARRARWQPPSSPSMAWSALNDEPGPATGRAPKSPRASSAMRLPALAGPRHGSVCWR